MNQKEDLDEEEVEKGLFQLRSTDGRHEKFLNNMQLMDESQD